MSRILFINRFFYPNTSATSQILTDLAFSLQQNGYNVNIITTSEIQDSDKILPQFEIINGVSVNRVYYSRIKSNSVPSRLIDYFLMYFYIIKAALYLVQSGDCIVIKSDPPLLSVIIYPITILYSVQLINWHQDLYPEVATRLGMSFLSPIAPLLFYLRNKCVTRAFHNVVIGKIMKEYLLNQSVPENKVSIIPNWCNDDLILPLNHVDNKLRNAWGLKNKFVIGYAGNLGRAHEYQTILGACELLRDTNDIVFLIIGGGHQINALKSDAFNRGLSSKFIFKPHQSADNLAEALNVPDLHLISLLPNLEGLIVPSKFYGIAAAGRASVMIGSLDGEISQIMRDYDCGISVAVGDSTKLADIIVGLKNNTHSLSRMGNNARMLIKSKFSKHISINKWVKILNQSMAQF